MDNIQQQREMCHYLKNEKNLSRAEIAQRVGISERQVKRRLLSTAYVMGDITTAKISSGAITSSSSISDGVTKASKLGILDDYFGGEPDEPIDLFSGKKDSRLFNNDIVDKQRNDVKSFIEGKYGGSNVKALYLADLHIPFTDYKKVSQIIKDNEDADFVVINGDLLDLFAVSKFAKDKEVALRREMEEGREFLEFLTKKFGDVIITEGNHERRLRSFIKNIIPTDMQFLFPDDVLRMVVDGSVFKQKELKNAHVVGSWWLKLFDTIYAHPDNYTNANLKTVQNTSEHFSLVKNEWHRMCVIGHTHRAGWIQSGEVKLMETGCLCHDMDYHNGSKFTKTVWTKAYATTYFDKDGLADFNKSKVIIV